MVHVVCPESVTLGMAVTGSHIKLDWDDVLRMDFVFGERVA